MPKQEPAAAAVVRQGNATGYECAEQLAQGEVN